MEKQLISSITKNYLFTLQLANGMCVMCNVKMSTYQTLSLLVDKLLPLDQGQDEEVHEEIRTAIQGPYVGEVETGFTMQELKLASTKRKQNQGEQLI